MISLTHTHNQTTHTQTRQVRTPVNFFETGITINIKLWFSITLVLLNHTLVLS